MHLDRLNARLRGRRDGALGADGLRGLLAAPTLEARLHALAGSRGWAGLAVEPGAPTLAGAERALREALRHEASWLLGEVEGGRARRQLSAWLGLGEADAVKALLRGVAASVPIDALLRSTPAGSGLPGSVLQEPLLTAAARASTPAAALAALAAAGHPLAAAVAATLAAAPDPRPPPPPVRQPPRARPRPPPAVPPRAWPLAALEAAVDGAAQQALEAACAGGGEDAALLRGFAADRADAVNVGTLLALAGAGGVVPLLPGGRLDQAALDALARLDSEPLAAALAAWRPGLGPALASPWGAEIGLQALQLQAARLAARDHPLSIAVPVAHLLGRRLEAALVAAVLRGAALGMAEDDLMAIAEAACAPRPRPAPRAATGCSCWSARAICWASGWRGPR